MKHYLSIYARGLLMGTADVVPGISGGTVALIVGVYYRLVRALSSFDLQFLTLLRTRQIRKAAAHIDLAFLVTLGAGVVSAIATIAKIVPELIEKYPVPSWSLFFGLVLASTWIVGRMVASWGKREVALWLAGALFGYWVVGLIPMETPQTLPVVFGSGLLAICAMLLPGISGSFILVILGQYVPVLQALRDLNIPVVLVFCAGCAVGLLAFSRFLRWLLSAAYTTTLVFMCGLMAGSLRKLWPWKVEAPGQEMLKPKHRIEVNVLPEAFNGEVVLAVLMVLAGLALVVGADWVARSIEAKNREADLKETTARMAGEPAEQRAVASRQ